MADANDSTQTEAPTQEEFQAILAEREALKGKNAEILREAKAAKAALKNYEGIDPEEARSLKAQAAEAAQRKAIEEGSLETWKAQFVEQFAKEKEPLLNENKTLRGALERRLVDAEATAALAAAKGSPKVLLPHIKSHVKVVEEDGEFVVHVVDAKGNQRIGDAKGTPMTISQLIDEMKQDPDFARNFEGTGSSGGGASASRGSATGTTRVIAVPSNGRIELGDIEGLAKGTVQVR